MQLPARCVVLYSFFPNACVARWVCNLHSTLVAHKLLRGGEMDADGMAGGPRAGGQMKRRLRSALWVVRQHSIG